jgi:hypothetical protein
VNEKWDELSLSTSLRNIKQQLLAIILKVELVAEVKTILLGMLIALYRTAVTVEGIISCKSACQTWRIETGTHYMCMQAN